MVPLSQVERRRNASGELAATALRLAAVLAVALLVGLAARMTMGPPLF